MSSHSDLAPGVVVVTGASSVLGRLVTEQVAADPEVSRVVALDERPAVRSLPGVESHTVDLQQADLKPLFEGATAVVHLAQTGGPDVPLEKGQGDGALARRILDAASSVGVEHVVLLSSAVVYGAWANVEGEAVDRVGVQRDEKRRQPPEQAGAADAGPP